jgi:hypothetical protein
MAFPLVYGAGHPYSELMSQGVAQDIKAALYPPVPEAQFTLGTLFTYNGDHSIRPLVSPSPHSC